MPDEEGREVISGRVTRDSFAGWHAFKDRHECSITALLEAIGLRMAQHAADPEVKPNVAEVIDMARAITRANEEKWRRAGSARRKRPSDEEE